MMPDRENVIRELRDIDMFIVGRFGYEEAKKFLRTIDETIILLKEQDEKEGHWIVLELCANEGIYCSKCMNKIFDRSTKPKKKLSNYCPNCGSKNTHFFNPSTEKIMYSD